MGDGWGHLAAMIDSTIVNSSSSSLPFAGEREKLSERWKKRALPTSGRFVQPDGRR
ncbi:MAG: hypothetical protein MI724_11365 [Spirochaetales bacterium]|nr:hypothetical protein [Spirochaetales bacterium]